MSPPLLLDTHALLWLFTGERLSSEASSAIDEAWTSGGSLRIAPISAWELGMLVRKGRLALPMHPLGWFQAALDTEGITLAEMPPRVLVDASFLPASQLRDPVDQILVATARANGFVFLTRDAKILEYAEAGHLRAIAC